MSVPTMVKRQYLAMAYVANNDTNELLITTSEDGVYWSSPRRTGQSTNTPPVLAAFENQLVLVFAPRDNPQTLMYCTSTNGVDWSPARLITSLKGEDNSPNRGQSPALVAFKDPFKDPTDGDQMHLSYAAEYDLIRCCTAKPIPGRRREFEFLDPYTITIEDKAKQGGISRRFSHGRRSVVVHNDKLIMAFIKEKGNTLSFATSGDVRTMLFWQSPQDIVGNAADPAIVVLKKVRLVDGRWVSSRRVVVAWRYDDGSNRLGIATIGAEGQVSDITKMDDSVKYGPALTTLDYDLVLAFVANDGTNNLLVRTSASGVKWSPIERIGHSSKTLPALATSYFIQTSK